MKTRTLAVDEKYCWGCQTCEVACKQENRAPDGVKLISLREDGPREMNGKLDFIFRIDVCRHCDEPPCAEVCPVAAIAKREDGIVILDEAECTGCRACLDACPYDAVDFDEEKEVARKCNLCFHRVDRGLLPACADNVCPGHCIHFGDPDEIEKMPAGLRKES